MNQQQSQGGMEEELPAELVKWLEENHIDLSDITSIDPDDLSPALKEAMLAAQADGGSPFTLLQDLDDDDDDDQEEGDEVTPSAQKTGFEKLDVDATTPEKSKEEKATDGSASYALDAHGEVDKNLLEVRGLDAGNTANGDTAPSAPTPADVKTAFEKLDVDATTPKKSVEEKATDGSSSYALDAIGEVDQAMQEARGVDEGDTADGSVSDKETEKPSVAK